MKVVSLELMCFQEPEVMSYAIWKIIFPRYTLNCQMWHFFSFFASIGLAVSKLTSLLILKKWQVIMKPHAFTSRAKGIHLNITFLSGSFVPTLTSGTNNTWNNCQWKWLAGRKGRNHAWFPVHLIISLFHCLINQFLIGFLHINKRAKMYTFLRIYYRKL